MQHIKDKGETNRNCDRPVVKFRNSMVLCEATGLEVYMGEPNNARFIFSQDLTDKNHKHIQAGIKVLAKIMLQLEMQIMSLNQRYNSSVKAAFIHARNLPPFDQVSQLILLI